MRMRQTEEIPPVWIRSEATYAAALTQPGVSLPSSADLRRRGRSKKPPPLPPLQLCGSAPSPLLNAATRHRRGWASAAQPWKRRRRVPEGPEMLGKHVGQSATVFRAVGRGLNPAGRVKKRRTTAERCTSWNVFYLSGAPGGASQNKQRGFRSRCLNNAKQGVANGRASETMVSRLKANYHDRHLNNGTRV